MTPAPTPPLDIDWSGAHTTEIQVRFGDVDSLGHVNNVAYAQYLEIARVAYMEALRERGITFTMVVARLEVDYVREVKLRERVTVELAPTRLGASSFDFHYRVLADGVVAAAARTVQVNVEPSERRPRPLPEDLRRALERDLK
ncbi:acyl-CoA thioesterase [Deinococcus yavapaiensis]|uniref:Acyl-CoA thioester hydrolase n=1 Tax=Deinococcus yavapaiensis KR-236 TaxID=694435 RepID=A0A318S1L5_9DEIO|nr:thioesterase family protein [Deinococcus yavapaiensis]PYE50033.1 acyl-CoA thioester hydrolase [Deinococcus yavapaiensis KR-236]